MRTPNDQFLYLPLLFASIAAILLGTTAAAAMEAWPAKAAIAAAPTPVDRELRQQAACGECAVVSSLREIRNAQSRISSHEVTVRMQDGSNRVFIAAISENWRAGARLILIDGADRSAE